jgi:excisionase family DNA binding protein
MIPQAKPAMRPLVYRLGQAADLLGISKVTLWRRIKDGTLQGVKIGPRAAGVTSASVHRLIEGAAQ